MPEDTGKWENIMAGEPVSFYSHFLNTYTMEWGLHA